MYNTMTVITLKDEYFTSSTELNEDGVKACDLVRAFTGLMLTNTYSIGSIIEALKENVGDLEELVKLANDVS